MENLVLIGCVFCMGGLWGWLLSQTIVDTRDNKTVFAYEKLCSKYEEQIETYRQYVEMLEDDNAELTDSNKSLSELVEKVCGEAAAEGNICFGEKTE